MVQSVSPKSSPLANSSKVMLTILAIGLVALGLVVILDQIRLHPREVNNNLDAAITTKNAERIRAAILGGASVFPSDFQQVLKPGYSDESAKAVLEALKGYPAKFYTDAFHLALKHAKPETAALAVKMGAVVCDEDYDEIIQKRHLSALEAAINQDSYCYMPDLFYKTVKNGWQAGAKIIAEKLTRAEHFEEIVQHDWIDVAEILVKHNPDIKILYPHSGKMAALLYRNGWPIDYDELNADTPIDQLIDAMLENSRSSVYDLYQVHHYYDAIRLGLVRKVNLRGDLIEPAKGTDLYFQLLSDIVATNRAHELTLADTSCLSHHAGLFETIFMLAEAKAPVDATVWLPYVVRSDLSQLEKFMQIPLENKQAGLNSALENLLELSYREHTYEKLLLKAGAIPPESRAQDLYQRCLQKELDADQPDEEFIVFLLKKGAFNETMLPAVVAKNFTQVQACLLPILCDEPSETLYDQLAYFKSSEIIRYCPDAVVLTYLETNVFEEPGLLTIAIQAEKGLDVIARLSELQPINAENGISPLEAAYGQNDDALVEFLFDKGAKISSAILSSKHLTNDQRKKTRQNVLNQPELATDDVLHWSIVNREKDLAQRLAPHCSESVKRAQYKYAAAYKLWDLVNVLPIPSGEIHTLGEALKIEGNTTTPLAQALIDKQVPLATKWMKRGAKIDAVTMQVLIENHSDDEISRLIDTGSFSEGALLTLVKAQKLKLVLELVQNSKANLSEPGVWLLLNHNGAKWLETLKPYIPEDLLKNLNGQHLYNFLASAENISDAAKSDAIDIYLTDQDTGYNAFDHAVLNSNLAVAEKLLEIARSDLDSADRIMQTVSDVKDAYRKLGRTVDIEPDLHTMALAVERAAPDTSRKMIKILESQNEDTKIVNGLYQRCFSSDASISIEEKIEAVRTLKNALVNHKTKDEQSLLYKVLTQMQEENRLAALNFLIDHGANITFDDLKEAKDQTCAIQLLDVFFKQINDDLNCPVMLDLFEDPVLLNCGHTIEKLAKTNILCLYEDQHVCPICRAKILDWAVVDSAFTKKLVELSENPNPQDFIALMNQAQNDNDILKKNILDIVKKGWAKPQSDKRPLSSQEG